MKMKLTLSAAAVIAFAAMPVLAQHSGGHGSASSSHGASSSMSHGNSANAQSGNTPASSKSSNASVSERLADNTKLAGKLQSLLPAGTDLKTASPTGCG